MEKIEKIKRIATAALCFCLVGAMIVGGSYAYKNASIVKGVKPYEYQISWEYDAENAENMQTDTPVESAIEVDNAGDGELLIRVRLEESLEKDGTVQTGVYGASTDISAVNDNTAIRTYIQLDKTAGHVVKMADWDGSYGDFWVLDTDGWLYYANPLADYCSTVSLVDSVTLKESTQTGIIYQLSVRTQAMSSVYTASDYSNWQDASDTLTDFGNSSILQTPAMSSAAKALVSGLSSTEEFADNLAELYSLADAYSVVNPISGLTLADGYEQDDWLTFSYLRSLNSGYTSTQWTMTAGACDSAFSAYVTAQNPELAAYFIGHPRIANMDVYHMAATVSSIMYNEQNTSILGPVTMGSMMSADQYNTLSGWGGDLQTFIGWFTKDTANATLTDSAEIYNAARLAMGNSNTTFDFYDLCADMDALNLAKAVKEEHFELIPSVTTAIRRYFSQTIGARFAAAIAEQDRDALIAEILPYTKQQYQSPMGVSLDWLIFSNSSITVSAVQSQAISEAFADYLLDAVKETD